MYLKFTADKIFTVSNNEAFQNKVIITNKEGKILAIDDSSNHAPEEVKQLKGWIVPGFVNAHCHLELSHMKSKVNTGTGLLQFIEEVITTRAATEEFIQECISNAEQEMINNGIVAVGDISNTTDTFVQKQKGNLYYYSFVEFFDMFQADRTQATYNQYKAVYDAMTINDKNQIACVPHAPYSVSKKLFELLQHEHQNEVKTISIHNQETPSENEFLQHNTGALLSFYNKMNLNTKDLFPINQNSIYYALQYLLPKHRNLFVHNTQTSETDIEAAHQTLGKNQVFWCTCPNANLYIENSLPNYQKFLKTNATVCIGTDSLTSNWQLSIFEEMKTILKYQSYLDFETILNWATINGAKALGLDNEIGTIEIGKTSTLVLIDNIENNKITQNSTSKKII